MILVTNGCSYTAGYCLTDYENDYSKYAFGHTVKKQLNCDFVNLAKSSGSNDRIIRTTMDWLLENKNKDCFVFTVITNFDRFELCWFNDNQIDWLKEKKEHLTNLDFYNDDLTILAARKHFNRRIKKRYPNAPLNNIQKFLDEYYNNSHDWGFQMNRQMKQFLLLESYFKQNNIKYGFAWAMDYEPTNYPIFKEFDQRNWFEPYSCMVNNLKQKNFKEDNTGHFYPEAYENYGNQIAKWIKEKY
jgi:hypothetical protein